jgi:uncharacterized membrane protein required for colicin V production
MTMVDLYLLGIIGGFVFGGWRTGFVRRLAGLGFLVAAFVAAAYLREPAAAIIEALFPTMRPEYPGFIGFGLVFGAILLGLHLASRPFLSRIAVTGLSRTADRGLGAGLGLLEGALLASVGIVIVTTYADDALLGAAAELGLLPDIAEALEGSFIARVLMTTTVPFVLAILGPLLPSDIDAVVELLP